MKKKTRNILIVVGAVCLIFAGIAGYGAYSVYSFFTEFGAEREIPEEIKDARILSGDGLLTKSEIFKLEKDGLLKTIGKASQIKDEKERKRVSESQTAKPIFF